MRMVISIRFGFSARARQRSSAVNLTSTSDQNKDRLSKLIPRERRAVYALTHLSLPWVYQIVSHPRVSGCGRRGDWFPTCWCGVDWFVKFPGDAAYISWHQDGACGACSRQVTTAWIALLPARWRAVHAGDAGNAEDAASSTGNVRDR